MSGVPLVMGSLAALACVSYRRGSAALAKVGDEVWVLSLEYPDDGEVDTTVWADKRSAMRRLVELVDDQVLDQGILLEERGGDNDSVWRDSRDSSWLERYDLLMQMDTRSWLGFYMELFETKVRGAHSIRQLKKR